MKGPEVVIFAVKKDEKILFERRGNGQSASGLVLIPGGKIEDGESKEMALNREVMEELGVLPIDPKYLGGFVYEEESGHLLHLFLVEKWKGELDNRERKGELLWLEMDEAVEKSGWQSVRDFVEMIRNEN